MYNPNTRDVRVSQMEIVMAAQPVRPLELDQSERSQVLAGLLAYRGILSRRSKAEASEEIVLILSRHIAELDKLTLKVRS